MGVCPRGTLGLWTVGLPHAAGFIHENKRAALTPGFFRAWALRFAPGGHGVFITLTSMPGGLRGAPAQTPQHTQDARGARGDPEVACNDGCDPSQRPEGMAQAMITSALAEEVEQVLALLGVEAHVTAALAFGIKAALAVLRQHITPPTDRRGRGFDMSGHLMDTPASFKQGDGDATSDFSWSLVPGGLMETLSAELPCHFSFFKDQ